MKKARFNFSIDPLEAWSAVAGLIVFIGLGLEIGPEAWGYFITWYLPPRELFGSAMVAMGVFAEVAIGIFIARSSSAREIESNREIARLNAETERLRQENNDTALLLSDRSIGDPALFIRQMLPFAGTLFFCEVPTDNEPRGLYFRLAHVLRQAGWIEIRSPLRRLDVDTLFGVTIFTVGAVSSNVAEALADWLTTNRTGCRTSSMGQRDDLALGTIMILVGPKPPTIRIQQILEADRAEQKKSPRE